MPPVCTDPEKLFKQTIESQKFHNNTKLHHEVKRLQGKARATEQRGMEPGPLQWSRRAVK